MGSEFLLLMTLERAFSLLLIAVLDTVNLMNISVFSSIHSKLTTKIQKLLLNNKNICLKILIFGLFCVISHSENENNNKI